MAKHRPVWHALLDGVEHGIASLESMVSILSRVPERRRGSRGRLGSLAERMRATAEMLAAQTARKQRGAPPEPAPEVAKEPKEAPAAVAKARTGTGAQPYALRGTNADLSIPSLLELLSRGRKTGTLCVTDAQTSYTLDLVDGQVVQALADQRPPEERLGAILVDQGALLPEKLEEILASRDFRSLGEALQALEVVPLDQLRQAIEQQTQLLVRRLFAAEQTTFSFYERPIEAPPVGSRLNVMRLLLESARTLDESRIPRVTPEPARS